MLFGPPALWAVARSWLDWQGGRHPTRDVFAMSEVPTQQTAWTLLLPSLITAVGLLTAGIFLAVWWRRGGSGAVKKLLAGAWVLLWLAGTAALFVGQSNLAELGPAAATATAAPARVLGIRPLNPSLRQAGGSELILRVQGMAGPQQVQISDRAAAQLRPGDALALRWAEGRYYGRYLVTWARVSAENAVAVPH